VQAAGGGGRGGRRWAGGGGGGRAHPGAVVRGPAGGAGGGGAGGGAPRGSRGAARLGGGGGSRALTRGRGLGGGGGAGGGGGGPPLGPAPELLPRAMTPAPGAAEVARSPLRTEVCLDVSVADGQVRSAVTVAGTRLSVREGRVPAEVWQVWQSLAAGAGVAG